MKYSELLSLTSAASSQEVWVELANPGGNVFSNKITVEFVPPEEPQ